MSLSGHASIFLICLRHIRKNIRNIEEIKVTRRMLQLEENPDTDIKI